ncbi:MAG: amidohydrolase [Burkholderiales bacterium]|nr:amidohydrolase [Burkholderiales bacterium]
MFVSQEPVVDLKKASIPLIESWKDEFREIRQDFHRNPEIGLDTPRTSKKIADFLRSYGVDEVHEKIGGCGVVGVVYGSSKEGASLGLRADIDALPMKEMSDHDHVSCLGNRMHGCGHDGHGATLLAVAKYLAQTRNFVGKAILIFQPGEEGWSGAKVMMDDGLFERFPVQEIYAYHTASALRPGELALNYGAMQAAADAFTLTITGKGGHGSRPENCSDPIVAAAYIITALQTLVSRNVSPLDSAVVSCGSIHSGDPLAQSVIPNSCQIVGTTRTFKPGTRDLIEKRLKEVAENTAAAFGCTAVLDYDRKYPPLINSEEQAKAIADVGAELVGEENMKRNYPRATGGEDFAFMAGAVPGAYIRVGQGGAPAHNGYFDFNDEIIPLAATLLVKTLEKRFKDLAG